MTCRKQAVEDHHRSEGGVPCVTDLAVLALRGFTLQVSVYASEKWGQNFEEM